MIHKVKKCKVYIVEFSTCIYFYCKIKFLPTGKATPQMRDESMWKSIGYSWHSSVR